jgi:hypothetical protein
MQKGDKMELRAKGQKAEIMVVPRVCPSWATTVDVHNRLEGCWVEWRALSLYIRDRDVLSMGVE